MRVQIPATVSHAKYKIDFTLVPVAIILIEFAVFLTQYSQESKSNLSNLVLMRIIHTIIMISISLLVSQIYMRTSRRELSFLTLSITGIFVIGLGDLLHAYLASLFGIELISVYRRLGIILIQGSLWFPAFMIVGGNRKEIFAQFREYESRLIAATRAQSRTSLAIKEAQKDIQLRIRSEFYAACKVLQDSITAQFCSGKKLNDQYEAIAPLLSGDELRKLSRSLDISSSSIDPQMQTSKSIASLNLFIQQFRILYTSIVRSTPLRMSSYAFVFIALVTPQLINYYSLSEFLITDPILLLLIFIFSKLIIKTQSGTSKRALRNASLLIFLTGLLPLMVNFAGQVFTQNSVTRLPIFISALIMPITYYLIMELLQVLRPSALSVIRTDQLKANVVLQKKVEEIVKEDFLQTLSHQWAVFIHGKTLTRLAATSLKLKSAVDNDDSHTFNETLQTLLTSLRNPDAEFEEGSSALQDELSSRLDPWRGFVDIKVTIAEELKSMRNPRVRVIGEVIEELISNSIRHGKAKEITLSVMIAGDKDIEIIALDDATVAPAQSLERFGLGTRIFNLASDGRWSITRVGSSTQFKLKMSIDSEKELPSNQ